MGLILKKQGNLEYFAAESIAVPHGFTTRLGGVSQGAVGSLNIGMHRGDPAENVAENHRLLAAALGYEVEKLVLSHQIHGDAIRCVTEGDCLGLDHHGYPECDGLITNTPGLTLCVFSADCTPILLHDPVTNAVGAVHAGWRGTALDIAGKAVEAMVSAFGCEAKNIRAAIGPNIGQCCFETGTEVPRAMEAQYGPAAEAFIIEAAGDFGRLPHQPADWFAMTGGSDGGQKLPQAEKFYLDLKRINALALRRRGVEIIDTSTHCTYCRQELYFSHRRQGANRGSQGALIHCRRLP